MSDGLELTVTYTSNKNASEMTILLIIRLIPEWVHESRYHALPSIILIHNANYKYLVSARHTGFQKSELVYVAEKILTTDMKLAKLSTSPIGRQADHDRGPLIRSFFFVFITALPHSSTDQ